mmetsp:Transcript_19295/g.58275  ORF Transcript_19295/g.58275 Transcript_19295/m.58275 type:complete len:141 (-) Transcript_19295:512-934(-)|eukprot:CAMPEP_0206140758 /NCGR_PEP_ID=MMETSP1473-20131121/10571_1 /ASSEMBLY_ACC=CAM_ASM_001109 /TAXON_ID=1461547 /ORGANISM="Stichococcus sp, Strain RCC1054" /LENGTH=140 /DNA_ID=CAMNT_0053535037 /DNA_START=131 /DNA_END=553 /DNA_ORIENTATION=-
MAFVVKVDATGHFFFVPSTDREYDPGMLTKGQHDVLFQYLEARHPLPGELLAPLHTAISHATFPISTIRLLLCLGCCSDQYAWDLDRDNDVLLRHIRGQLTGILELHQYELTDCIGADPTWKSGRSLLKLWLKHPDKYEA